MTELVDFLRARLSEDEQAAKLVQQPYRLYVSTDGRLAEPLRIDDLHGEHDGEYQQWPEGDDRMPNHVTNWSLVYDPARVLRDVEADRRIIALHKPEDGQCSTCSFDDREENAGADFDFEPEMIWVRKAVAWPCPTLCLLAAAYADHADYNEAWRP